MATQNLGNVRALIVSATAPTNTNLIWRDTSTSPFTTRIYNTQTSIWVAISMTGSTSDPDAIHDNMSGEIAIITEKTDPVNADIGIIEDSENGYVKKRIQLGNLPYPISRTRSNGGAVTSTWSIDFASNNEFFTTSDFILNINATINFSNDTNAELAVLDVNVTGATRTITMPLRTYMQTTDSRWTSSSRQLELEIGRYKMTFKKGNDGTNTIYSVECSDQYVTT